MGYPKQTVKCSACKGYKRVAIITTGPKLFVDIIGKPLPLTFAEAQQQIANYKGTDAGGLSMLVRRLARNLDTTACPWCKGTGIQYTLQQLTPEEAAATRKAEEGVE